MDTTKGVPSYRGVRLGPWEADIIVCAHCGNRRTPKGLCDGCGSFAMKVVKAKDLNPRRGWPVANVQAQPR